ncbi:MAG: efflux RND transporter permease subunit, partial [Planctomycetota bacterium]
MTSLAKYSVENPVLVGVLMTAIIIGGLYGAFTLVRELYPESRPNQVVISTVYPGATPAEIEKGISIKIEEAVKDIEHIEKIETRITEGLSSVIVTMTSETDDIDQVVNDFKAAIDTIDPDELPQEAEETHVYKFEPRLPVIQVSLYGDLNEEILKKAGRRLKDDLLLLPGISNVELSGTRKDELTVEVEPEKLVEYKMSLSQIAEAIHQSNLDLPGGQLKTPGQNVSVRTLGESDQADLISETIVRTTPNGQVVRVADLGQVTDGFEDTEIHGRFNGKSSVSVIVYKTAEQDAIDIATKVKAFVAGKRREPLEWDALTRLKNMFDIQTPARVIYKQAYNNPYPGNINIATHNNLARFIESRLDLLKRNGLWGLSLVFVSLMLFLNWRVAFWVMMGLVLSICGAIMLMKIIGETLNLISVFGLIVVLGLIVDDAIVVGENIYSRVENGEDPKLAAIKGTEQITWPITIAVITTIAAFLPLLFIEGQIGDIMGVLPIVVTCALAVSLIEALSILPTHLAEWLRPVRRDLSTEPPRHIFARMARPIRRFEQHAVIDILGRWYERVLRKAVEYRYVTVAAVVSALIVSIGFYAGGRVPFVFIQKMDAETIIADLEMPVGTPAQQTQEAMQVIEETAMNIPAVKSVYTLVGLQLDMSQMGVRQNEQSHLAQAIVELATLEERNRTSEEIIAQLRSQTADIPGVNSLRYVTMQGGPGGAEIEIEVTGEDTEDIRKAADALKGRLAEFDGVYDIADDFEDGRREVQITLLDSARPLGLTTQMLATEVRGALYGLEARTLQRDNEDVDIRVRFPEERRKHIYELESMRIVTASGKMVPFCEVAQLVECQGSSAIRRVNQRRAVVISTDVDHKRGNPEEIIHELVVTDIDRLERELPGLTIAFSGKKHETVKAFGSLKRDFAIAVLAIFVLLAGLFKSYIQPLIVLVAIPFGLIGVIVGHYLMGYPLTILSMTGVVALTGIVVNDALILVDYINHEIAKGQPVFEAVINGGRRRLRPIILTSLTTILGLAPLMAEQSFQARFLIPMAVSISFGLAFATILTLIVVPAIYIITDDAQRILTRLWY